MVGVGDIFSPSLWASFSPYVKQERGFRHLQIFKVCHFAKGFSMKLLQLGPCPGHVMLSSGLIYEIKLTQIHYVKRGHPKVSQTMRVRMALERGMVGMRDRWIEQALLWPS